MRAAPPFGGNRDTECDRGSASRVTISPTGTEGSMARGCSFGIQSAHSSSKDLALQVARHLRLAPVQSLVRIFSTVTWLLLVACVASALLRSPQD